MKKLMTMIGAAVAAFGLYANTTGLVESNVDFTDMEPGEYSFEEEDPGAGAVLWWKTGDAEGIVTAGDPDNFLALEADAPIYRTAAGVDNVGPAQVAIADVGAQQGGIVFDQLVKFSAYDENPTDLGDAKIAVWVKAVDADETQDGSTNLMITCGNLTDILRPKTGDESVEITACAIDNLDKFYQLTITAIEAAREIEGDLVVPGFMVELDGTPITYVKKLFPADIGDSGCAYTSEGAAMIVAKKLFPSLIDYTTGNGGTLQGVGFKGTGSIKSIDITPKGLYNLEVAIKAPAGVIITGVTQDGSAVEKKGDKWVLTPGKDATISLARDGYNIVNPLSVVETIEAGKTEIDISDKVTVTPAVAQIVKDEGATTNLFATLAEAFTAAADNDTIEVVDDVELEAPIKVAKKVTLDIGAFDVTPKAAFARPDGSSETIDAMFVVKYGADFTVNGTDGVIDCSAFPSIYSPIKFTEKGDVFDGETRAKLTVDANLKGYYYAIVGNGDRYGTDLIVNGGELTAGCVDDGVAIFNPQANSTVIINGGALEAYGSAIEMRGGTLTVNGGTLTATCATYATKPNGSGSTTMGAAVAVAQHTTKGDVAVEIKGGTLKGVKAVSVANPQGNTTANVAVTLGAATYNGALAFSADKNATVINNGSGLAAPEGYQWNETTGVLEPIPPTPTDITVTVKKASGIASVTVDGKALVFDETTSEATFTVSAADPTATLTLAAESTIKIPVYTISEGKDSMGWLVTNKTPVVTADTEKANYFTFAAEEASTTDPAITDEAAATAIKEAAPAVADKVDELTAGGAIGGKALVKWIANKGDNDPAAALAGDYVKASVNLDVAPITEGTEIKIKDLSTGEAGALTFKIDVGTDSMGTEAQLNAIKGMVKATSDVADWTTVEKQLEVTAVPNVDDGTVTVTPKEATDKAFMRVVVPKDTK